MDSQCKQMDYVFDNLAKTNDEAYNFDKLMEEMHELAEVILKIRNKKGYKKEPTKQDLIDELGDVKLRLEIAIRMVGESDVNIRVGKKLGLLADLIQAKQYTNRI